MSQALFTSMTGLNVAQQSINVVANNVANINTTAYKSADARFATLFSNTLTAGNAPTATAGGTNPKQIGLGVKLEAIARNFNTGSFLSTDISSDSMISGRGYYTVMDASGNVFLTRDGGFTLDANGDMITATGNKVLGAAGIANEEASLTPIHVPQAITPTLSGADLTSSADPEKTLGDLNNATFTSGTIVFLANDGTNRTPDGQPIVATISTSDVSSSATVDDFCNSVKTAINNAISAYSYTDDDGNTHTISASVTVTPNTDGTINIKLASGSSIQFTNQSTSNFTTVCGFDEVTSSSTNGIDSKVLSYVVAVDPEASPTTRTSLSSYSIGSDGSIEASYDNGDKMTVVYNDVSGEFEFQYVTASGVNILDDDVTMNQNVLSSASQLVMQIATVTNEAGLVSRADNLWTIGPDTGDVTYTVAGQMGTGTLQTGGLEGSNVDLARELSNMIIAQRAINANSRVFGTASSVMETLSQLGR
ncbi:flagellar hook-basal body complex protein [bacterium]|nr:flagellar hook-basal body complex protein [bacterium]